MSGNEEVIELSIDETQALRAKLGLPPLRGVPNSSSAEAVSASDAAGGQDGEELSLSVVETNFLRQKIGLPPLKISNKETKSKGTSASTAIHAPPTNTAAETEARNRIEDAAAKREALDRLKKLAEENELVAGKEGESAIDFAAKMRQSSATAQMEDGQDDNKTGNEAKKKKKKGSKRALSKDPRLALPVDEAEEGEVSGLYTASDLKGMKVSHAASDFEAGTTTVLTLADKSILDVDPDSRKVKGLGSSEIHGDDVELVNVDMESDTKALENLRKKRQIEMGAGRAGGYAGYDDDEFDELGGIGVNAISGTLAKGPGAGSGSGGRRFKGFAIGGDGTAKPDDDKISNTDLFGGSAMTLESRYGNKVASDFMIYDKEESESREEKMEKERMKQMKMLEKMRKKDRKTHKRQKKSSKRSYSADEEEDGKDNGGGSLLASLEATAVQDKELQKRKRRRNGGGMDNDTEKDSGHGHEEDADDAQLMKEKRNKFEQIMEKGKLRTDNAFNKTRAPPATNRKAGEDASPADDEDDAFLNAALAKARRLKRLKELNGSKSSSEQGNASARGEIAVLQTVEMLKQTQATKVVETDSVNGGKTGLTFEFDEMQEFTRALRAREDQVKRAPDRSRGTKATTPAAFQTTAKKERNQKANAEDDADGAVEDVDMEELANEMTDPVDEKEAFGSTAGSAPIGRGMSNFLSLLKQTGEIKNAGREEMRGRAKDKRTYEDYETLNLNEVVKIDTRNAHEKDIEFANREIKLEYRDDFGRLLTRKEAYRNMCYDFHGHGSSKKNQERRLKQIAREREEGKLASRQVMAEGGVGTLGALKATQKATGKAFIIHKT
mmetsp:Transcript_27494/g.57837  ORF Transcript_27494/g.57837 Transcript_27494/m.57837 type:complete len:839 (-) Transcript_27494:214-2730(-)